MIKKSHAAFTLVEMLVVISIIAIIAALAFPAISGAIVRAQLTQTVSNARQVYLAGFQMATDGSTNSDPNLSWPGDYTATSGSTGSGSGGPTVVTTLQDYCNLLVANDYLKPGDLQKVLSAPGANLLVQSVAATGNTPQTVVLTGRSGLKIYKISQSDPSNAIFAASANYIYNNALTQTSLPYGDKGFVIIRKGGDASSYRKNQATQSNNGNDITKFQNAIGVLPLPTASGSGSSTAPTQEDATMFLSGPTS
jgi:prepilin-type N-terminal cleavage/methylation domain-containing protein